MDNRLLTVSNAMMAFSTFLGVLFAMVYYIYQIIGQGFFVALISVIIYIDINLLFLYILRKNNLI